MNQPIRSKMKIWLVLAGLVTLILNSSWAQDIAVQEKDVSIGKSEYSPYLYQSYPDRVFWGDTHLHTSYSTDAGMIGNRLGPG